MRLIDADKLIERLEAWNTSDKMDKAHYNFTRLRVMEQPTAYDVDKVCEELHHCGAFEVDWEERMAIDIVKRGGVDEID